MTREIKFRVWDGEQMVSPDYISREGVAYWKSNSIPEYSKDIMQFTGILDKNGKEIYEGDFLKSDGRDFMSETDRVAVKFSGSCFVVYNPGCCKTCRDGFGCICSLDEYDNFDICGNIYENPELLNQTT